jgi:hypothetical protein
VVTITTRVNSNFSALTKFSSFSKTIRVTAYVLRFIHNSQKTNNKNTGQLANDEIKRAHDFIIKMTQLEAFNKDIHHLTNHKTLPKTSKLKTLQPFLDKNGSLRVTGRLKHASLAYEQKHHHVTKLIIQSYHISHLHAGCQATMTATRQRYWTLSCRDIFSTSNHF